MPARVGDTRATILLAALSLSTFVYVTTETLPIGLLPLISADLGRSVPAIGMLVTVYGLTVVLCSIPITKVTQRLPRRLALCGLLAVFVLATAASALADSYWLLMAARIATALSQALFWSVVTPATAALFRPAARPRALAVLYAGSSLAALAGVPAGTWLGQQAGWRAAFLAVSVVGLLILVTVLALMPTTPAGASDTDRGSAPDAGRYVALLVYTALATTGAFAAFTYISPFLTDVSGFSEAAVGPLLLVRGLAGLAGVFLVGLCIGRNGWLTVTVLIGVQLVALTLQWSLGASQIVIVVAIALGGLALAGISSSLGVRVLETAPGGSDMALAGTSTAFNLGITAGALLGGVLLPGAGLRGTALAGAGLTLLALVAVLMEPLVSTRRRTAADRPEPREAVPS
ncbi:MFS transporter [Paractinoplanes brasiliensis]|uniref:DHA1 family L-arabinose/isopropyl-beta-D-thiogalactopyranoside export protein-like MFS transporter/DHA1 family inner membrane transport protein n=1 Tax=Paractinoplanes brasiliensis TaxID=52695 RepID=A0A4R6JYZ1_9ACTN|nr:MFS transporter [Actinoplanes brasiliensis]TDO42084.1 DHA1 family L-arabinose/isopropyl-beta-D-thiogalactopyranoside export protein-like MFS transporter/DHA1 family inner membrane transport protein [Actinoplanes brasiliensis]GID33041.1 MFS transporter [Actinoplanes brasiliensis]